MAHRSMLQGRGWGRGGLAELRATQKLGRGGGLNWDGTEGLWRLFPEKVTASDHGDRVEPTFPQGAQGHDTHGEQTASSRMHFQLTHTKRFLLSLKLWVYIYHSQHAPPSLPQLSPHP